MNEMPYTEINQTNYGLAPVYIEDSNLKILQKNLQNCLNIIDDEVMKGYVTRLNQLPIVDIRDEEISHMAQMQFFKISELVYKENEFAVDKLSMVFNAISNKPCTLALMLKSDGMRTEFYLGIRPNGKNSTGTLRQMLKNSLLGFFPGSKITEYFLEDMEVDFSEIRVGCVSAVTSVADYKQQEKYSNEDFIQGLENFVYSMQGKKYTTIFIANNLSYEELMKKKREYERIYTQISPFANMHMAFSVSDSKSKSLGNSVGKTSSSSDTRSLGYAKTETDVDAYTEGSSRTISHGKTDTNALTATNSESRGNTYTTGSMSGSSVAGNVGVNIGIKDGLGASSSITVGKMNMESTSDSVSKTLSYGLSSSKSNSISVSESDGKQISNSKSKSIGSSNSINDAHTVGETFSLMDTESITDVFGASRGLTLNSPNMTLNLVLKKIQKHLERLEECESFGMWNFGAYFIGDVSAETETAANIYKSIVAGTDSGLERNAINTWNKEQDVEKIWKYLKKFFNPLFVYNGFSYEGERNIYVNPTSLVSTNELAIHMGLPRKSVCGLPVVEHAEFGKEIVKFSEEKVHNFSIGNIYTMGRATDIKVDLDINSLAMHTFITGSTGSGKSNTIYEILYNLKKENIPFLIIEPAKGEYKQVFGGMEGVSVYGTNPKKSAILRINPFKFPKDIHILEHLDRLVEIFNVCWPMYAAMPAVLKESIERAYLSAGWDLALSENRYGEFYPTFSDVLKQIKIVLDESDYSVDNKGDYTGALVTRIKSFTNGINGLIFTTDDIDDADLFDKSVIIDLSRVGSTETKAFVMGLLVLKLQEYRLDCGVSNSSLRHVTVLEEAHNLLRRTATEQSNESSNLLGKSVEMLANSIAEMRTYGEGFIIADQSPGLLDMSVIRNTNTKIILRLPEYSDRELVGKAAGLNDDQLLELAKLEKGVAAVMQNDWVEPVLCKVNKFENGKALEYISDLSNALWNIDDSNKVLIDFIMNIKFNGKTNEIDIKTLENAIKNANVGASLKCKFLDYIHLGKEKSIDELSNIVYEFFNAEYVCETAKKYDNIEVWRNFMLKNLLPNIQEYSDAQINFLISLILREKAIRKKEYEDVFASFVEVYEKEREVH